MEKRKPENAIRHIEVPALLFNQWLGATRRQLKDGDADLAWDVATATAPEEIDSDQLVRLAESREAEPPSDALEAYLLGADEILQETDRRAYARAERILKRARSAADAAGERHVFDLRVSGRREQYRRRPTMIAMFDKASL